MKGFFNRKKKNKQWDEAEELDEAGGKGSEEITVLVDETLLAEGESSATNDAKICTVTERTIKATITLMAFARRASLDTPRPRAGSPRPL